MSGRGLFVVGTDTGVGKTVLASTIARELTREGRRVGVLKPVATGATCTGGVWQSDDVSQLIEAIGGGVPFEKVTPFIYEEPLAPVVAARRCNAPLAFDVLCRAVDEALAWWAERSEAMVVEGVGGLLTPLAEGATIADLAIHLDYPLVIVARKGLGTLNHTLLTVEAAVSRGLRVAGVVLNSAEPESGSLAEATNAGALARLLDGIGILGEVGFHEDPRGVAFAAGTVDWYNRMGRPRGSGWSTRG